MATILLLTVIALLLILLLTLVAFLKADVEDLARELRAVRRMVAQVGRRDPRL